MSAVALTQDPSTVRTSFLAPPETVESPANGTPQDTQRADAVHAALLGRGVKLCGVPVRQLTFADVAMLRHQGSWFATLPEEQTEGNLLESVAVFLFILSAKRTLDEISQLVFDNTPKEVIRLAVVDMGDQICVKTACKKHVEAIEGFIKQARSTKVDIVPDPTRKTRKKKEARSPVQRSASSRTPTSARASP
jgi:hypothetical protein